MKCVWLGWAGDRERFRGSHLHFQVESTGEFVWKIRESNLDFSSRLLVGFDWKRCQLLLLKKNYAVQISKETPAASLFITHKRGIFNRWRRNIIALCPLLFHPAFTKSLSKSSVTSPTVIPLIFRLNIMKHSTRSREPESFHVESEEFSTHGLKLSSRT